MADFRAFAIYAKLVTAQQRLANTQARILEAAGFASSSGPVGQEKSQNLFSAATLCVAVNAALVVAINAIQEKQSTREALDIDLATPVFDNLPLKNVYQQFGSRIDSINDMMDSFDSLLDAARDTVSQITEVIAQHNLSSEPAFPVGVITGVVTVAPLPPPVNPPVTVVAPLPTPPPPPPPTTSTPPAGGGTTDPPIPPNRQRVGGRILQGA